MQTTVPTGDVGSCAQLIREMAGTAIHELVVDVSPVYVRLTGWVASWHMKQVANTAAQRLYPKRLIDNQLRVVTKR